MSAEAADQSTTAFSGWDSSMYFAWLEALSDLMMSANSEMLAKETLPNIGGLVFALTGAASELSDREMKEAKVRQHPRAA